MHALRRMLLVTAFLGVMFAALPAMAQFTVCNESPKLAYVAVGHWDNYSHVSEGWWIVPPGTCKITYPGDLEWQWYYVYGRSDVDDLGNYDVWSGDYPLCIHWPNGFTIVGNEECDTGFFELDTGISKTFTFTLE
jgi:uncharacterized membrane protein